LPAVWVFPQLQKNHLGFKAISQNVLGAIDVSELSTGFYFANSPSKTEIKFQSN
jgi:hypothetical protein